MTEYATAFLEGSMRYATVLVDPGPGGFYEEYLTFLEHAEVTRERIHYISLLDDGTVVGLYELQADPERLGSGLEAIPQVLSFDLVGEESAFLYLHEEATEPARTLLSEAQKSEIVLDLPLEYTAEGTLRVTMMGSDAALRRTLGAIEDVVEVRLEKTGDYHPDTLHLASFLTDQQREILRLAVDRGYYDVPRNVTHREIAEASGLSQSTVAEHLQKVEAKIVPHVIR